MRFAFDEEQLLFRKNVREVLARVCPPSNVREAWSSETGRSRERWQALHELGVVSALVPEAHGGLGMNEVDLVLALEECGRAALPEPIVETAFVVVPLLRELGAGHWLERIASGEVVATIACAHDPLVTDAHFADLLVLPREGALHAIAGSAARITPRASVDGARRMFEVQWSPTEGSRLAADSQAYAAAHDRAAVGFGAFLLGLARTMIETTVAYAKVRTQFGQPIGSFQAVKHQLADAHLAVEMAAPMVDRAAYSIARGDRDASLHASMAKARASDAAIVASRVALQVHGAIGYSVEHDLHLFMKRAWALAATWGDAAFHRRALDRSIFSNPEANQHG